MKIKVGKEYKSKSGSVGFVECRMSKPPLTSHPYLVTFPPTGDDTYGSALYMSEEGKCRSKSDNDLVPNIVKRWSYIFTPPSGNEMMGSHHFDNKEEAEKQAAYCCHGTRTKWRTISFEEEIE